MDNEGDEQKHFSSRSGTDNDESDLEYDDLFENVSGGMPLIQINSDSGNNCYFFAL